MAKDFKDRPAHDEDGFEIPYQGSTDAVYDEPVFEPGDRVEFTADYPSSSNRDNLAAAGATAEIVGIAPTRDPLYLVKLDSKPDAKWPLNVSGGDRAALLRAARFQIPITMPAMDTAPKTMMTAMIPAGGWTPEAPVSCNCPAFATVTRPVSTPEPSSKSPTRSANAVISSLRGG